jgi:two-component system, cell cycle sensor histidine kinase and response regulator CckA
MRVQPESAKSSVKGDHEIILLVEDEPVILKLTTRMLELQGYCVLAASTPSEAMRIATRHIGNIRMLITDVIMPEMNGSELANSLLSLHPHLKTLFMSGYTADLIAHQGVLDPGVYFLQKPFSTKELAAKVKEVLDRE